MLAAATGLAAVLAASGCGGGARLDAHEPSRAYSMEVVKAAFPTKQSIAKPTVFTLEVRNPGSTAIPNVAVTLDSFNYTEKYPELAADKRPIWVIERGPGPRAKPPVPTQEVSQPGGAQTVYVNTWALGPLARNATRTFTWHVVPVKAGVWTVHFSLAAGLAGKARAQLPGGGPAQGQITASVAPLPPNTHVDPSTGRVVAGTYPLLP
ncbi:MAG TPA: hypothetical protein VGO14_10830 [Solirubrobacteraceae bacterium]|jgi:hypothetical protein|nr:hypothetical protein [Solirubrobacteraceae bacterium]